MTATLPTQEQVDQIAHDLAPDVARIRVNISTNWWGDPAIYFRVTLSDEASSKDRLHPTALRVERELDERLALRELEHFTYFKFRRHSEQEALKDRAWA